MKNILLTTALSYVFVLTYGQVVPLPNAHAHNDYHHKKPLFDALSYGFTSIEADVFLIKGELYVAHVRPLFRRKKRTLKNLYLEPLRKHIQQNKGEVYPNYQGDFYLMIDIKTDGRATELVLKKQLAAYRNILSERDQGNYYERPVTVFLSGNRTVQSSIPSETSYAGIDGRPSHLGLGFSAERMPVISTNYKNVLDWRGGKSIPDEELQKLKNLVNKAHAEGKKVRFWASPERIDVWEVLYEVGVDLINTDKLEDLKAFLLEKKEQF